jgi:hypothetical protein
MRSKVPDGPVLDGWQPVGRWHAEPEFIIGGKHGLRFYVPRRRRVRRDVVAEVRASERCPREIVRGDGDMSGTYFAANQDAPGGLTETAAQVAAGLSQAMAATQASQVEVAAFLLANGQQVVPGHPDTHGPSGGAARS